MNHKVDMLRVIGLPSKNFDFPFLFFLSRFTTVSLIHWSTGSPEQQLYEDDSLMALHIQECLKQKRRLSPIIWGIHFSLDEKYRLPSLTRHEKQTMAKVNFLF